MFEGAATGGAGREVELLVAVHAVRRATASTAVVPRE
eukprot:CAMPEP_0168460614 /NCGR_PEP_ID=MMETSP0228-20121227/53541_1 /TAXON_ID=133427 /ORGANISM="Protoceratium reticulatum, Strain CCCM 535 (=CCMP 1889)" /LENGTH=36 /DNA_ID= /DNA_START= /DNA_END= /DNA_ORIENTATION=